MQSLNMWNGFGGGVSLGTGGRRMPSRFNNVALRNSYFSALRGLSVTELHSSISGIDTLFDFLSNFRK